MLDKYWDVGGVRIEGIFSCPIPSAFLTDSAADNILITESGYENLTTTAKEVEDMYKLINGS